METIKINRQTAALAQRIHKERNKQYP